MVGDISETKRATRDLLKAKLTEFHELFRFFLNKLDFWIFEFLYFWTSRSGGDIFAIKKLPEICWMAKHLGCFLNRGEGKKILF